MNRGSRRNFFLAAFWFIKFIIHNSYTACCSSWALRLLLELLTEAPKTVENIMKLWLVFCVEARWKSKPLNTKKMNPPNMPAQPALKMPIRWGDRVLRVQSIQTKINSSIYIPVGWGWVICGINQTQLDANIATFIDAESRVKAKEIGAVGLRNAAFAKVHNDLRYIMCLVKGIAFNNENIATTIIESCGYL